MVTNKFLFTSAATIVSLAAATMALAQSDSQRERDREQARQRQQNIELQKCSELIGSKVQTEENQDAGKITEIALDLENAQPFYCIVDTDGVSGMNDKLIPVPFKALTFSKFQDNQARMNINMARLKDAPDFKFGNWGTIGDPKWGKIVHQHYAVEWAPRAGSADRDSNQMIPMVKATEAMKLKAFARQRDEVGQSKDFIIDTRRATIPLALITLERDADDKLVAVPMEVVDFNSNERVLVVRVDRDRLREAPSFDRNSDLTDTRTLQRVYTFYNVEPDGAYGYVPPERDNRDDRESRNRDNQNRDNRNVDRSDEVSNRSWMAESEYGRLFKSGDMTTINGRITNIERITPRSDMSPGVKLVIRGDGDRKHDVHLGPWWFIERQYKDFQVGDEVRVTGATATLDGDKFIMATEVKQGDRTMVLRDRNGVPVWDAWNFQSMDISGR
jgi:hypothetical protein